VVATCYLLGVSTRRMDKLVQSLGIGRVQRLGEVRCVLEVADLEPVPDPEAGVDGPDDRRGAGVRGDLLGRGACSGGCGMGGPVDARFVR